MSETGLDGIGADAAGSGGSGGSDPYARQDEIFPRLEADQVERVSAFGVVEDVPDGTQLFHRGQRGADFFVVLSGSVEILERHPDGDSSVVTVHREHQFTGELDLFNDRQVLVDGRAGGDSRLARLDRAAFRRMLAAEPDVAAVVMQAFILRRVGFLEHDQGGVTIVGSPRDAATLRLEQFLARNNHPFATLDPESDREAAEARLSGSGVDLEQCPVVLPGGDEVLVRPTRLELAEAAGISEPLDADAVHDVVVVGGGPAGLATAVYAASEGLDVVVLEGEAPGGQAGTSSRIENYLGFPLGLSGQELAGRAQVQAQKFGARIAVPRQVRRLRADDGEFALDLEDGSVVRTHTVVVASGASYRRLPQVEDLERHEGAGVHYAATAVEAALVEGGEVVVVGGGNSAGQAAVFLARYADHVHVLVRGDGLADSMSEYLSARVQASSRITVHPHTEVRRLHGERFLEAVTWEDTAAGEESRHDVTGLFLMLGATPNTAWLDGLLAADDDGFLLTGVEARDDEVAGGGGSSVFETSTAGVYAVGDVRARSIKRVASAVGQGSVVVSAVHERLAAASEPDPVDAP